MSRLIDADKIDDKYREIKIGAGFADDEEISPKDAVYFLSLAIDAMPTVNAVEVVRCKDCKYSLDGDINIYEGQRYCTLTFDDINTYHAVWDNDYCSYGKRRGEEE